MTSQSVEASYIEVHIISYMSSSTEWNELLFSPLRFHIEDDLSLWTLYELSVALHINSM